MNINTLKTGDLIVRKKGIYSMHYIVWIGWKNGVEIVAENHNGQGVRYTSLKEALAGRRIERFERFGGTEVQRNLVVPKINDLLGKSYNLIVFNCEHFARWISNGKVESKQVKTASNLFLITGAVMVMSKNSNVRFIGIILIVLGGLGRLLQS